MAIAAATTPTTPTTAPAQEETREAQHQYFLSPSGGENRSKNIETVLSEDAADNV